MGFGYALGGAAQGFQDEQKIGLARRQLDANTALRAKAMSITQQRADQAQQQNLMTAANKNIADSAKLVENTIAAYKKAGKSPDEALAAVAPIIQHIQSIGQAGQIDVSGTVQGLTAMAQAPVGAEGAPKQGSTLEGIKAKIAAGQPLTPGEQTLYDDAKRQMSLDQALLQGLLGGDTGTGATTTPSAPSTSTGGAPASASATIPPIPAPLAGKNPQWSPSKQRWRTPDGQMYNQQGIPVSG